MNKPLTWKNKSARDKPLKTSNIARLCSAGGALQETIQDSMLNTEPTGDSADEEKPFTLSYHRASADTLGYMEQELG